MRYRTWIAFQALTDWQMVPIGSWLQRAIGPRPQKSHISLAGIGDNEAIHRLLGNLNAIAVKAAGFRDLVVPLN